MPETFILTKASSRMACLLATLAMLVVGMTNVRAASLSDVEVLRDRICALNKEEWVEPETVESGRKEDIAYDAHHTTCNFQFVAQGQWYSLEYRHRLHVSRNWRWREARETLTILILQTDDCDAQNTQPTPTKVVYDRKLSGKVVHGSRSTFGGTNTYEHYYSPPDNALSDDELCVSSACDLIGQKYAEGWQRIFDAAVELGLVRLK